MKKITFLIIPDHKSQTRSFSVSISFIKGTLASLVVLSCIFGFWLSDYVQLKKIETHYYVTISENNNLKSEAQLLIKNLKEVKDSLKRVQDYTVKLNDFVNLKITQVQNKTGLDTLSSEDYLAKKNPREDESDHTNLPMGINIDRLKFRTVFTELSSIEQQSNTRAFELQQLLSTLSKRESLLASIPSITPVRGWITSHFGVRISPFTGGKTEHKGLDIAAPEGSAIRAPADGVVTFSGKKPGFGNFIMIAHYSSGVVTAYGHNAQNMVQPGQTVKRGEQIGTVGMTGRTTGPHVHYETWINGIVDDPMKFILDTNT